ncbi:TPA: hypothetical protein ACH3X2_003770 [Trebouxia sp. C0005]
MTPETGTSDNTEYLLLTPHKLIIGSKKELLAILKKVDPTGFVPQHMPELRIALLNIAFTQNPALKATLRRASSTELKLSELDVQPPRKIKIQDDPLTQLLVDSLPENDFERKWTSNKRLGSFSSNNRKPRPVLIRFPSMEDKHQSLQLSEPLRQSGLRLDDWLTKRQQKERDTLNTDFQTLKGKGYKPFFRGSVLMYRRNDKACVCQQDKVDTVPPAL